MSGAAFSIQDRIQARLHAAHKWNDPTVTDDCFSCRLMAAEALQAVLEDQAQLEALVRYGRTLADVGERTQEFVYVFESGGRYKIGTTRDVAARMVQIQRMCPLPVRCVMRIDGGRELEQHLHEWLSGYRLHGEWFDLPRQALDALCFSLLINWVGEQIETLHTGSELDALVEAKTPEEQDAFYASIDLLRQKVGGEVERRGDPPARWPRLHEYIDMSVPPHDWSDCSWVAIP